MLKIKGWLRAAALCMAFCLLLTGCSIPMQEEKVQVEELLRAPRLAGDYGALQTALNDWLGESAQLKYPLQGDLLSPFVLQDFDGDGEQDAAVFYTTALTSNVCVAFLRKNSGGAWQVSQTVEGLGQELGLDPAEPGGHVDHFSRAGQILGRQLAGLDFVNGHWGVPPEQNCLHDTREGNFCQCGRGAAPCKGEGDMV